MLVRDLSQKSLADLTKDDLVYLHIAGRDREPIKEHLVMSCLDAANTSMRHSNGNTHTELYAPTLCAFAILDQLGTCYRDKTQGVCRKKNGISKALHNFCGIPYTSAESDHLYMFRNGMVHAASMTSEKRDTSGNIIGFYIFRYSKNMPDLVKPATRPWDGSLADIGDDTISYINRDKLVDLASNTINKIRTMFQNGDPALEVIATDDTIRHNYLLWLRQQTSP